MARYEVRARFNATQDWTTILSTDDDSAAQTAFDKCKAQASIYDRAKIVLTQVVDSWESLSSQARRVGPPLIVVKP